MSWPSYSAFVRDDLQSGSTLCCPVRVLWFGYLDYCREWGFERPEATDFVRWLRAEEGVTVVEGGRGRLRRYAVGIGFNQVQRRETA